MALASTPRTLFDKLWQSHVVAESAYERERRAREPWLFN